MATPDDKEAVIQVGGHVGIGWGILRSAAQVLQEAIHGCGAWQAWVRILTPPLTTGSRLDLKMKSRSSGEQRRSGEEHQLCNQT